MARQDTPHTNTWTPVRSDFQAHTDGEDVRPPNGIFEFGRRYGVYAEFIPFGNRSYDPLARLEGLRAYLEGLPKLTPGFTVPDLSKSDVMDENAQSLSGMSKRMFHVCRSRQFQRDAHKGRNRYVNPSYVHLSATEPAEADEERRELLRDFAQAAVVPIDDPYLPAHFGADGSGELQAIADALTGFEWDRERYHGKRKMARTWHTMNVWGTPTTRIADAFGVSQPQVARWIQAYSLNQGFEVPDDPTKGGWRREVQQAKELREQLGLQQ